jgi:hypothetical protein
MNFDKVISASIEEMGLPPVRWYTKKEYVIVLKGEFERNSIKHTLSQTGNLGRISFADHQISDKRISRDQLKAEIIEDEISHIFSLKITVLGRNPIEIQHEREERKILNQGECEILKIGENFNLILGGDFFQISIAEIAEDGSILDEKPKSAMNKKESPVDNKKSFSRSTSNMDTQAYTPPPLNRSNSSDLKILSSPIILKEEKTSKKNNNNNNKTPSPSPNQQNKRKRNSNESDSGRDMRKKGKIVNYKDVGSDDDDFERENDEDNEEEYDGDEDEKLARKLQREYEKENDNYKIQKSGKKKGDNRKMRNRNNIVMEDSSEEDTKRIKAEIADGGPDSPYEDDDLWAQDKTEKYKSEEEEISLSDNDDDDDEDDEDDDGIPKKKIPCQFGIKCYRQNPDHLRRYSHPNK